MPLETTDSYVVDSQSGRSQEQSKPYTSPFPIDSETYSLERFQHNALLIFNHSTFEDHNHVTRIGTEIDVKALHDVFRPLGFRIKQYDNLTFHEIMENLEVFGRNDFSDYGSVFLVFLTHGTRGRLSAADRFYDESYVYKALKKNANPTLLTKPIVIIIQACRGDDNGRSIEVDGAPMESDSDHTVEYQLPVEANLLIVHSTLYGRPSFRNSHKGSWLIQTLCQKIKEHSYTHDFESILTVIRRDVALNKVAEMRHGPLNLSRQVPVVTSTLLRKLFLRRFGEYAPSSCVLRPHRYMKKLGLPADSD